MAAPASPAGYKAPRLLARGAGFFYLGTVLFGICAELVRKRVIVPDDATATAQNILGLETFFRGATSAEILAAACYVGLIVLLHELLRPVNKTVSALAAALGLVAVAIGGVAAVSSIATLLLEKGASYLAVFSKAQLEAVAFFCIRMHGHAYSVSLIFFGFYFILIGYLMVKSGFIPVLVGALAALPGLCYLVNSFSQLLAPSFATFLSSFILYPTVVGKAALILWLVIAGINVNDWNERNQAYRRVP